MKLTWWQWWHMHESCSLKLVAIALNHISPNTSVMVWGWLRNEQPVQSHKASRYYTNLRDHTNDWPNCFGWDVSVPTTGARRMEKEVWRGSYEPQPEADAGLNSPQLNEWSFFVCFHGAWLRVIQQKADRLDHCLSVHCTCTRTHAHTHMHTHNLTRISSCPMLLCCLFGHLAEFCIQSKTCRSKKQKHPNVKTVSVSTLHRTY